MEDLLQKAIRRRTVLKALGGAVALGAVSPTALVAACGGGGGTASNATVTMWGNHPEWKPVLDAIMKKFADSHSGITVSLDYKPGPQYQEALNTALAANAAPDVIGWPEGVVIQQGAKNGQIADLTGKLPVDQLIPAARAQVEFGGKAWGSPLAAYTVGMFYQKPVFQKYNITPPTDWAGLMTVCKQLKAAGEVPMAMPAKDGIIPYFFYHMAVDSVLGPSGFQDLLKGRRKLTDPDLIQAAQYLYDLRPYFNAGFEAVAYAEGKALFAQGKTAMIIGGSADYTGYKQVNPNVDVSVFGMPSPKGDLSVTVTGMELLYTVNSKTKVKDQATTLVAWLSSKEAQQIVADQLARPVAVGVASKTDPVNAAMVKAGKPDLPVWYDLAEVGGVLDTFTKEGGGLWTGRLTPAQLAATLQDAIKPSS